jgi:hypothetical protein
MESESLQEPISIDHEEREE